MTVDEAIAAVEATLDSGYLRVDRARPREDETSYLLVVLDTSGGRVHEGVLANGPRLVDKRSGEVTQTDRVGRARPNGPYDARSEARRADRG